MGVRTFRQPVELTWTAIRELSPSPRLVRLHRRLNDRYAARGQRLYTEADDVAARDTALLEAYRATVGQPAITRRAHALAVLAERLPARVEPDDVLVGHQTFNGGFAPSVAEELAALGYARTTGHIVHDYGLLLSGGLAGLTARVGASTADSLHRAAFETVLAAFRRYVARHAAATEGLERLVDEPPRGFREAVQLLWLAHTFLHAENPSVAISFGRLDQLLDPYLRRDLASGSASLADAFETVGALLLRCSEGEESQNAVLGGVDADGRDGTNATSLLFCAAMARLRTIQPSLTVRLHPEASPELVRAACGLAAAGTGNPGFMNDAVVIAALQAVDIPLERARDWSVVGCYEACPSGDSYANTVLGQMHLPAELAAWLASPCGRTAPTFDAFLDGWYQHVARTYHEDVLARCQATWNHFRDHAPSPFGSLLMPECLARGLPLEAGGARFSLVGINLLGLGTVVDSLQAIRTLVFERGEVGLAALADAVAAGFPDEGLRRRLAGLPGRYGSDSAASNSLAREVSSVLARMVLDSRLAGGVRPYPAFFAFGADIHDRRVASPDGRRASDLISYGVAPAASVAAPPTAVLRSAANAAQHLAACGCPCALTLPRADLAGEAGAERIRQLVEGYFALGGSHLHVNAASADELRAAQADPASHAQLTVRVSGFSARFVLLDPVWQQALIERAEQGR